MKIGAYRRVNRGDLGDVPAWVDTILETLQSQIEQLTNCLMGNVTLGDNIRGESQEVRLVHGVETVIRVKNRPRDIQVSWVAGGYGKAGFSWRTIDKEKVGVTILFQTQPPDDTALVRIVFTAE
jgi:hypothetical protein